MTRTLAILVCMIMMDSGAAQAQNGYIHGLGLVQRPVSAPLPTVVVGSGYVQGLGAVPVVRAVPPAAAVTSPRQALNARAVAAWTAERNERAERERLDLHSRSLLRALNPAVQVRAVAGDITTPEGRAAALAACPQVDILVNNAGGPPPGDFRDWNRDDWLKALDANMLTPIELIKATVDGMIARRFGRIVNITSGAVKAPIDVLGLSNGARSGLTGFVAGLARKTVKHNVTINNLLPGVFDTDRVRSMAIDVLSCGLDPDRAARQRAAQLVVVVAEQHAAAPRLHQGASGAERLRRVGAVVREVAELQRIQPERLGARDGGREGRGIAVHIADGAKPREAGRAKICKVGHHAASAAPLRLAWAARARARPAAWSTTGRG